MHVVEHLRLEDGSRRLMLSVTFDGVAAGLAHHLEVDNRGVPSVRTRAVDLRKVLVVLHACR